MFVARADSPSSHLLRSASVAALLMASAAATCGSARAQGASDSADIEEVVVPGSRIAAPGFQSTNPVTEVSSQQYEAKQVTTVVDLLDDIPALTVNQNRINAAEVGASRFDLHGLGGGRTLVLVDGLRTAPTSVNGGFDINVLPASLIQRIEIVSGGASAAYGSDAVAGVVNIILNTSLEGLRGRAGYGTSAYGDDQTFTGSAAWGTSFAGDRGHVVVGGDYFNQNGVDQQSQRPWGRNSWGRIANPGCTTITTTCSEMLISPNVVPSQVADGGVIITAGPLKNTAFGPGGTPMPFVVGTDVGTTHMIGGSGSLLNQLLPLQPAVTRANMLAHATYDLGNNIEAWGNFLYAKSTQRNAISPNSDNGTITITNQNPYIPASILAIMTTNKITQFAMGRANYDLGTQKSGRTLAHGINQDYDGSAGLRGTYNAFGSDWSWDINGQYFSNNFSTSIGQNRIEANWTNALDAVANPAVGGVAGVAAGQPVCRSTLTAPTNGCVPANVFGPGTITAGVRNYVTGTSWVNAQLTMLDTSANVRGVPFSTWAGPVAIAFGGEYRRQSSSSQSDAISAATGWRIGNFIPYKGSYSVEGGYLEAGVPLARNAPLAVALDIDAAIRLTSFTRSGGVVSWKLGFSYSPTEELHLHGSRSHDIRGPTISSLFQAGLVEAGTQVTNPATGVKSATTTITQGNPDLNPEIGDTFTAGATYAPDWFSGFNVSANYWNSRVSDVVTAATEQQAVTSCFAGQTAYCPAITTTAGVISQVLSTQFNTGLIKVNGWDFEANYQFGIGNLIEGWDGVMKLRMLATYLNQDSTSTFGTTIDEAGCVGVCANPRLRYNLNAIYLNNPWTVSLTGNWLGGGAYDQLYNGTYTDAQGGMTINNNKVDGRFYVNLSVMYQWSPQLQLFARASNLFNTDPPVVPDATLTQFTVSRAAIYDRIGTQWLAGVKFNLK